MKQIQLSNCLLLALVDDDDFARVQKLCWCVDRSGYAVGFSSETVSMHRFILNFPSSMVDHINGNKLDNRKENLRLCTKSQNMANQVRKKISKSGYKGVQLPNASGSWVATIKVNKKAIYLGSFATAIEAAHAYNEAAVKYFGEFANINKLT